MESGFAGNSARASRASGEEATLPSRGYPSVAHLLPVRSGTEGVGGAVDLLDGTRCSGGGSAQTPVDILVCPRFR